MWLRPGTECVLILRGGGEIPYRIGEPLPPSTSKRYDIERIRLCVDLPVTMAPAFPGEVVNIEMPGPPDALWGGTLYRSRA